MLVGTHRVLSRDVVPQELGLVVLDEEQRFGVAQKELLRQLRLEVDVLAMSATPIPRTLHMSLSGLRDISVITTPPRDRHPIKTHVGEFDEELIAAALRREAARGGQSFYLHNRVETIEDVAERVRRWVPELRVGVAHGQMPERALEGVMMKFLRGDFDVLVSTTIIESGLDIPQANTLIVERADTLGLAQLYQIRGRVGRSNAVAHAFLFYPDRRELSEEARHRLSTLADYTELGSGYRIAMRDLELRGAGNLLGDEQSGHVAAVGFELYCELLAEAVAELQGAAPAVFRPVRVEAQVDAYVPADYVPLEAVKIDLHRRVALAGDRSELREIEAELADRFGPLPEPVANLLAIQELRLVAGEMGILSASLRGGTFTVGPVALGSAEMRELRARFPAVRYTVATRELSLRLAVEAPSHTPEGAPGIGIARCYNRRPPRDCGVVRMGRTLRILISGRDRGIHSCLRRLVVVCVQFAAAGRRRGRGRYAHHPAGPRPPDQARGAGDAGRVGHEQGHEGPQGRDDRLHDHHRPAGRRLPRDPGAGREHRQGAARERHAEAAEGPGHPGDRPVLRGQPGQVPGRPQEVRPDPRRMSSSSSS